MPATRSSPRRRHAPAAATAAECVGRFTRGTVTRAVPKRPPVEVGKKRKTIHVPNVLREHVVDMVVNKSIPVDDVLSGPSPDSSVAVMERVSKEQALRLVLKARRGQCYLSRAKCKTIDDTSGEIITEWMREREAQAQRNCPTESEINDMICQEALATRNR